jgi:hypothetical protein
MHISRVSSMKRFFSRSDLPERRHQSRLATGPGVPRQSERRTARGPRPHSPAAWLRSYTQEPSSKRGHHAGVRRTQTGRPADEGHPILRDATLLSSKQREFLTFAHIVRAMAEGTHLEAEGFRARRIGTLHERRRSLPASPRNECIRNPQRPYAEHRRSMGGEDMVRPAWRHAEPGRNDLAPDAPKRAEAVTIVSVPILRGRRRFEESCP